MRGLGTALLAVCVLALAPVAQGATVEGSIEDNYHGTLFLSVAVKAADGETNAITVTPTAGTSVLITATSGPLTAAATGLCNQATPQSVFCSGTAQARLVSVSLGDGNDELRTDPGIGVAGYLGPGEDHAVAAGTIYGGDGDDVLDVAPGQASSLQGDDGDDLIRGGPGNDSLEGNKGRDRVLGGLGDDFVTGDNALQHGSETNGDGSPDVVDGGPGTDSISYWYRTDPVRVDLSAHTTGTPADSDFITGVENVSGGWGNDVLIGNASANVLTGSTGRDRIEGRDGDDSFSLTGDGDVIRGGGGRDLFAMELKVLRGFPLSRDDIGCGTGVDTLAFSDPVALPPRDCELAEGAYPQTGLVVSTAPVRARDGVARVHVRCPPKSAVKGNCRGTVALTTPGKRRLGTGRFKTAAGRWTWVRIRGRRSLLAGRRQRAVRLVMKAEYARLYRGGQTMLAHDGVAFRTTLRRR